MPGKGDTQWPMSIHVDAAYADDWTPRQVYNLFIGAYELEGIVGPNLTVSVDAGPSATPTAAKADHLGNYYWFHADIHLDGDPDATFTLKPEYTAAHEYGHAWSLYHFYITQNGNWQPWLDFRFPGGEPRLDTSYVWGRREIIADDYRMLFGSSLAISQAGYINGDITDPREVPGYKDWFQTVWAGA